MKKKWKRYCEKYNTFWTVDFINYFVITCGEKN